MTSLALIVGNSEYQNQNDLPCCGEDAAAIAELVEATGRFEVVRKLVDATSDKIRESLRDLLNGHDPVDEAFFYFSGHGVQVKAEFFYCGTDFDINRPNETGLSNTQLHEILRGFEPVLVTKVVDACNSGNSLIKSDVAAISDGKAVLNDVIQIASCQSSQFSVTGVPLSLFTRHFCKAATRKPEGPVYYSDIINTLRDDFIEDESHIPHFVSQGSGREKFVERAEHLNAFREVFEGRWESAEASSMLTVSENPSANTHMVELLEEAETHFVDRERADSFISRLFDGLIGRFQDNKFAEFYDIDVVEHDKYVENTTRSFIIRSLSNQSRPDNFVTASISRTPRRKRNSLNDFALGIGGALAGLYGDDYVESWHLELNCPLERAQMKVTFLPKYKSLDEIRLVVSCAPSLNQCYVFELSTRHMRNSWDTFDDDGDQLDRKWYELPWGDDLEWLVNDIANRIDSATKKHIDATLRRLKADEDDDRE